jgi:beta-phosphoglucomutase
VKVKIKGIIFDLDGVLVHTDKFHYKAWKAVADKLGIYFDEQINNRLRGVSRMESLDIILEKSERAFTPAQKSDIAAEKNKIYKKLLTELTPADVSKDVTETLKKLKACGYKLAIGSSSKNAKFILERIGLKDMFDAISDGNNITHSKPDPEVFIKAAEYLSLAPKACIVVEDAFAGIDSAAAGGFKSVGIGDASSYEKADWRILEFSEILKITNN